MLGSQTPRLSHVPEYVTSAGQEAIECAAVAGLYLDPWESFVLVEALGERADGKWAAFEVGLVAPRQNGKDAILEARELAGLFSFGEKLLIHSAHEQATASEHFRRLLMLIESVPEFDQRVLKAPRGKGAEAIELRGGQRIFFKTRTGGGGRGLTGDFVALNEAMILPVATTAALVPTMAARSILGNPQLWYSGSAVDQDKHEHGVVLARVRERGLAGAERLAYFDWSIEGDDPDQVPDEVRCDIGAWGQANPGMGIRISPEHIGNEAAGALGPREFAVERLGVGDWPRTDGEGPRGISIDAWRSRVDLASKALDPVCLMFDVTPSRSHAAIAAAGRRPDGRFHVEVVDHRPGTGWVTDRLLELNTSHSPAVIGCDGASPAAALVAQITQAGVPIEVVGAKEHAQACGVMFDAVEQDTVRHLGTQELDDAIRGAVPRPLGDAWAWSRKSSKVDISPLVAATLSLWKAGSTSSETLPTFEVFA